MARFFPKDDETSILDQIRSLGDDELLDFWEETQYLERFLDEERAVGAVFAVEYERLILNELTIRRLKIRLFDAPPNR